MEIKSAKFIKGIVAEDKLLESSTPQAAFIGRSNVGKSSIINALAGNKSLARTSSFPGRTQEINLFLINGDHYLLDLPGYGYAKADKAGQERIFQLINWYLFDSGYKQEKVVLIIDANIGPTDADLDMLEALEQAGKGIIIVANKIDKIKNSEMKKQFEKIEAATGPHTIIPFSADKKIGLAELTNEILG
jgi:GTP-binding protein